MNKWFYALLLLGVFGCSDAPSPTQTKQQVLRGNTMGTYYSIKYNGPTAGNYQKEIDSLFKDLDLALSTYVPTSQISRFNKEDSLIIDGGSPYFKEVFDKSMEVYRKSEGAFDPTIMPLVDFWGFGIEKKQEAKAESTADSLLQFIGLEKVVVAKNPLRYKKSIPGIQLDFSAVGKGYGVDQIGLYLEGKGIQNYLVEIGGEVRARGKSRPDKNWTIGINSPEEGAAMNDIHTVVLLKDAAIASSGNYRNYYEIEGKKYTHTINPKTGRTELNQLLSASVIAKDCMTADAYATACMVLGPEKAFALLEKETQVEGYLIFSDEKGEIKTRFTEGMKTYLPK